MAKKGYYAVQKGRRAGVYSSWDECKAQVNGFHGASFKKLDNYQDAKAFVSQTSNNGYRGGNGVKRDYEASNGPQERFRDDRSYAGYSNGRSYGRASHGDGYYGSKISDAESPAKIYRIGPSAIGNSIVKKKLTRKFYSVKSSNPNVNNRIFDNWSECERYVKGQRGLSFKGFSDEASARGYIDGSIGDITDYNHIGLSRDEFQCKYKLDGSKKFDQTTRVFCDGSALSNGKSKSRAGYGVYFEGHPEKSVSRPLKSGPQTNNRAEIEAVSSALDTIWLDLQSNPSKSNYEIHTDSEYVSKLLNDRYATYDDSKLRDLPNGDLVLPMIKKFAKVKQYYRLNKDVFTKGGNFTINWVKGHAGEAGNEKADELARLGAMGGA